MFRITRAHSLGRFATLERAEELREAGVTHILNVSESASAVCASAGGFLAVEWIPLEDRSPILPRILVSLLDTLHEMTVVPESHLYIHCIAGQLRSPTALWLYLIACGVPPADARQWIEDRSPDASPGSTRMVDDSLVRFARQHGIAKYCPHPRPEALEPFA